MSKPIIQVEHLRKKYSRNAQHHRSYGLRDLIDELVGKSRSELRKDEFYAVDDVTFDLSPGDCFALIGRNGSGKTTILKMLNGIVKPDGGRISITGRVQALINLGAGFSPRLSGRENIYNSASLMGMSRDETDGLMQAIIEFSELEFFIDSPVGTYSSGMKARLGFSVAIHLKPDILLIDEVLSVGDFSFQNKCFIRMEELKKQGVTIVFVSHSHASVIKLCERAAWIHDGQIKYIGASLETVQAYVKFLECEERQQHGLGQEADDMPKTVLLTPKRIEKSNSGKMPQVPEDDPEFILGISEPKVLEESMLLPTDHELFVLSGWYTATSEKEIQLTVNNSPAVISSVERMDVIEKYPKAPIVIGFRGVAHRDTLQSRNEIALLIDGKCLWTKTVLLEGKEPQGGTEPRDSIYGPIYPMPRGVEQIECSMLINGKETDVIPIHSPVTIRFSFKLTREVQGLASTLNIHRKDGLKVAAIATLTDGRLDHIQTGHVFCNVHIPDFDFLPGPYVIAMPIAQGRSYLWRDVVKEFYVEGGGQLYWGIKDIQHTYDIRVENADEDR